MTCGGSVRGVAARRGALPETTPVVILPAAPAAPFRPEPPHDGPRRIVVVASLGRSLANFRLPLLRRAVDSGHDVLALAPGIDAETAERLDAIGVRHREISLSRASLSPAHDIATLNALVAAFRRFRPHVILPYTAKPIVYANLAGRIVGTPRRYALFTGLGYAFSEARPTGTRALARASAIRLYRHALAGIDMAFAYNAAEERDIRRFRLVAPEVPIVRLPGSGVDTAHFAAAPPPTGRPRFLMIARLLRSKGVEVYIEAARILRSRGVAAELCLLGSLDPNPDGFGPGALAAWRSEGAIRYLGETSDVRPFIRDATAVVLPAIHREGMPRCVLEGMSMGRAIFTTDVPGCGESIEDGVQGFVVPAGDAVALAAALERLARDPALAVRMGRAGRLRAETVFDAEMVSRELLGHMALERPAALR